MCYVPSTAVFCSESIECFPGIVSKFFFKLLVTIIIVIDVITIFHEKYVDMFVIHIYTRHDLLCSSGSVVIA